MAINASKISGALIIGSPKGVSSTKISGALLSGPPSGVNASKISGALLSGPPSGVHASKISGALISAPSGAVVFNLAVHVRLSQPRDVFRLRKASKYVTLSLTNIPKLAEFSTSAYVALKPPAEFIQKTTAYSALERVHLLAQKITKAIALAPVPLRAEQLRGYVALHTFPFFIRDYSVNKYVALKYAPPIGAYALNKYAALKVLPPITAVNVCAYSALVEPRIHLQKLSKSVALEVHNTQMYNVNAYATLQPRQYQMFPRKINAYASVAGAPPTRVYKIDKYAAVAYPDEVGWVWKLTGNAALQALPPVKVQKLNKYLTVSVPPPVFTYRVGGYVTIMPKPTGMLPFKVSAAVVLASDPPHLFQMSGLVTLVPLGSIGKRTKKTALYATLAPGAPVASSQYSILVVI